MLIWNWRNKINCLTNVFVDFGSIYLVWLVKYINKCQHRPTFFLLYRIWTLNRLMRRYCAAQVDSFIFQWLLFLSVGDVCSLKLPGCHLLFFRYLNWMEVSLSLCDIIKYFYTKVTKDKLYFDSNYLNECAL